VKASSDVSQLRSLGTIVQNARRRRTLVKVRKNYWLDPGLVDRAKAALGTTTDTETVAEALRRVTGGRDLVRALAEGRGAYPDWADPYHEAENPR
jgi:Arc/MetJ family transcription regulator